MNGRNALHYAAIGGHLGVVKYYIERGCNPANECSNGWTCLHYAARHSHYDLVQYLVNKQKVDPMCQTRQGYIPLYAACSSGSTSVVSFLIYAMSKYLPIEEVLRCKGQSGLSPLHFAACWGKLEIVQLLTTKFNSNPS